MNRRSFFALLAALPIVGRVAPKSEWTVSDCGKVCSRTFFFTAESLRCTQGAFAVFQENRRQETASLKRMNYLLGEIARKVSDQ